MLFLNASEKIGFEVLTAVVMKSFVSWDITPCIPLKVNRRFEGTFCLHRQGRRKSQSRNRREAGNKQSSAASRFTLVSCLAYSSIYYKIEVTCSSETSVKFQQATWRISEDRTIYQREALLFEKTLLRTLNYIRLWKLEFCRIWKAVSNG
jgi:hypothetical protein